MKNSPESLSKKEGKNIEEKEGPRNIEEMIETAEGINLKSKEEVGKFNETIETIAEEFKKEFRILEKRNCNIDFKILLETHASKFSLEKFKELIKNADILLLEFTGWSKEHLTVLQAISRGFFSQTDLEALKTIIERKFIKLYIEPALKFVREKAPKHENWVKNYTEDWTKLQTKYGGKIIQPGEKLTNEDLKVLFRFYPLGFPPGAINILPFLLNTNIRVSAIDISHDDPEYFHLQEIDENLEKINLELITKKSFVEILKIYKEEIEKFAKSAKERDIIMVKNIAKILSDLIENDAKLREKAEKEKLNVLIRLGGGHAPVFYALQHVFKNKENYSAKAIFETWPFVYGFEDKLTKRYYYDLEANEELIAKALMVKLFENEFLKTNFAKVIIEKETNLHEWNKSINEKLQPTSLEDLKSLYEELKNFYIRKNKEGLKGSPLEIWPEFFKKMEQKEKTE